jgi:hypothetical protein
MLCPRAIEYPLPHRQGDQTRRLAQGQLGVSVAGEQDGALRVASSSVLQRRRHQRCERETKQTVVVERLAREWNNVDVIAAPRQSNRQRAEPKFDAIRRVESAQAIDRRA